jgi:hypothetical protein
MLCKLRVSPIKSECRQTIYFVRGGISSFQIDRKESEWISEPSSSTVILAPINSPGASAQRTPVLESPFFYCDPRMSVNRSRSRRYSRFWGKKANPGCKPPPPIQMWRKLTEHAAELWRREVMKPLDFLVLPCLSGINQHKLPN